MIRYVYLIKAAPNYLKVGISAKPHVRRGATIKGPSNYPLDARSPRLVSFHPGTVIHEMELHRQMSDYRVEVFNEWYYDTPEAREIAKRYLQNPILPDHVVSRMNEIPQIKGPRCPHCTHSLTIAEARSIRGALNAAERKTHSGGVKITCTCGDCPKCRKREVMRKYRANKGKAK